MEIGIVFETFWNYLLRLWRHFAYFANTDCTKMMPDVNFYRQGPMYTENRTRNNRVSRYTCDLKSLQTQIHIHCRLFLQDADKVGFFFVERVLIPGCPVAPCFNPRIPRFF